MRYLFPVMTQVRAGGGLHWELTPPPFPLEPGDGKVWIENADLELAVPKYIPHPNTTLFSKVKPKRLRMSGFHCYFVSLILSLSTSE